MAKKKLTNSSPWKKVLKKIKQLFRPLGNFFENVALSFPLVVQSIQLTMIYCLAFADLLYATLSNFMYTGNIPELLKPVQSQLLDLLQFPGIKVWSSPEKIFFLSYIVIELIIIRDTFKLSKLVKYNLLLIFGLIMIQSLCISYWDLFYNREILDYTTLLIGEEEVYGSIDSNLVTAFFFNIFFIFFVVYASLYIQALFGKFGTLPFMTWLTDSMAFWVRIKTPTMRFGGGKKKEKRK